MATSFPSGLAQAGQHALRAGLALARRLDEPRLERSIAAPPQHPLQPAAIRVERSRSQSAHETASQTAVTMWFGQGPGLPAPGSGNTALRGALRLGAGVLGAAALAALTTVAAQREARLKSAARPRLVSTDIK